MKLKNFTKRLTQTKSSFQTTFQAISETDKSIPVKNLANCSLLLLIFVAFVLGCSTLADVGAAQKAAEKFHARINEENFSGIYEDAAEEFKNSNDKKKVVDALRNLRDKMGTVQETKETSYEGSTKNGGSYATLEYETTFSNGKVKERFQYKVVDGEPKLVYYKYDMIE